MNSSARRHDQEIATVDVPRRQAVFNAWARETHRPWSVSATADWPVIRGHGAESDEADEGAGAGAADPWPELPDWPPLGADEEAIAAEVWVAEREDFGRADLEQSGGPWNV